MRKKVNSSSEFCGHFIHYSEACLDLPHAEGNVKSTGAKPPIDILGK